MKFGGTKMTGSSILTILGVICLATVIVSAILLSNVVSVTRTVHGSVTVGSLTTYTPAPGGGYESLVDLPASDPMINTMYKFRVPVTGTSSESANLMFVFSGTGVTGASSVSLNVWTGGFSGLTGTYSAGAHTLTFTYPITLSASQVNYDCFMVYNNAGTFTMDVSVYSA
jgi:hypothetical protein